MRFWVGVLLSLLAVFGVLLMGEGGQLTPRSIDGMAKLLPTLLLLLAIVGGFFVRRLLIGKPIVAFIVNGLALMLCVLLMAMRAYIVYVDDAYHRPTHTMTITATVQIDELSDGVYNPITAQPYRQKAVLTNIRATQNTNADNQSNPFYDPNSPYLQHTTSENLPQALTVLLSAYPPSNPNSKSAMLDKNNLNALSHLKVGERVTMDLMITPIVPDDAKGFDGFRWLLSRHIDANARVLAVANDRQMMEDLPFLTKIQKLREYYRKAFMDRWQSQNWNDANALSLSLLTGDRAFVSKEIKALYQYGGISHLLAISGAHVLWLAGIAAWAMLGFCNRFFPQIYATLPRRQLGFGVMVGVSLLYALFVGFEVPALRTVYMLVFVGLARMLLFDVSSQKILALVGCVMVFVDPYVLWQAGFWLSFVAVAILLNYDDYNQAQQKLRMAIKLQLYIFVAMLPISLLFFGKVSLFGAFVNMFFVPLFGLIIVPLVLIGAILYVIIPSIGQIFWTLSSQILAIANAFLSVLQANLGNSWLTFAMSAMLVGLFMVVFLVATNKVLPKSLLLLPLLIGVFATAKPNMNDDNNMRIFLLANDYGIMQILLKNHDKNWLILSAGSKKSNAQSAQQIADNLAIGLKKQGISQLSGIIIQNDDDNLAAAVSLLAQDVMVYKLYWAGTSRQFDKIYAQKCQAGQSYNLIDGSIEIITGYKHLPSAMQTCNIALNFNKASTITGDVASISDYHLSLTNTQILLDASVDDKLWQVHRLLCKNQNLKPSVIITHSQSEFDGTHKAQLNADATIIFGNHLKNDRQKSEARQKMLELTE